jgi:Zn-dependent alcohol dehydrogenase
MSRRFSLPDINRAFALFQQGEVKRSVVVYA